jgi:hypothetical protein
LKLAETLVIRDACGVLDGESLRARSTPGQAFAGKRLNA